MSYWSEKGTGYWLSRVAPILLLIAGLVIYKSSTKKESVNKVNEAGKEAYQHMVDYNEALSAEDMSILSPLTRNDKIQISYPNLLMNIKWDSLSNDDIDLSFKVAAVRKIFWKESFLNGIDVESSAVRSVAKGKRGKMIDAYNKYKK